METHRVVLRNCLCNSLTEQIISIHTSNRILGLYTTAVIVISQMMRKVVSDMAPKIMFDDLPYVDRILRLCLDIYLVRESGDLCLEEDLFAKLIFLYRSPETLIRSDLFSFTSVSLVRLYKRLRVLNY